MIGTVSISLPGVPFMDDAARTRPRPSGQAVSVPADAESTQDLVQRARSGDEAALNSLFTRYESRLRRWAHGRLPASARGPNLAISRSAAAVPTNTV